MAKTVDNFSTIEDFRKTYNELAFDVGDISGLRDALKAGNNDTIVDAINVLEDKQFFFQEFEFIATTNQVSFNGADAGGNTLIYKDEKVQVFKNEEHLRENVDYQVALPSGSSHTGITLIGEYASGQSKAMASGDRLTIYSFTGAFIGTNITGDVSSFFQKTAENTIQNINANGVILNGDNSSATTTLESGFTLQLAGRTFAEDDIITTTAGKKFQAPIISDSVASLQSGSLTSAVNGTFSGTVQAEQLTTTDDLTVGDDASIGGELAVTGNSTLTGNLSVNGNTTLGNASSDTITFNARPASNLIPGTNNTFSLGTSGSKWSNVHATAFTGNLTGNATGNLTGDVLSTGGQTILDSGTDGTNATARLSTITNDGSTTVLNVATGLLTGTVSSIGNHDTDNLSEGSSNLYFTNARADARVAAVHPNTDSLAEGSSNLYHTTERVQDVVGAMVSSNTESGITVTYEDGDGTLDFAISDTGSITEGSNLYFTNARADARIAAASISALSDVGSVSGASSGQILVFDSNGDLQVADNSTGTDSISEQTNKYFTDSRVNDVIVAGNGLGKAFNDGSNNLDGTTTLSVNTSNGVKIDGDDVELDYSVITDSDLTSGLPDGSSKDVGHLFFLI